MFTTTVICMPEISSWKQSVAEVQINFALILSLEVVQRVIYWTPSPIHGSKVFDPVHTTSALPWAPGSPGPSARRVAAHPWFRHPLPPPHRHLHTQPPPSDPHPRPRPRTLMRRSRGFGSLEWRGSNLWLWIGWPWRGGARRGKWRHLPALPAGKVEARVWKLGVDVGCGGTVGLLSSTVSGSQRTRSLGLFSAPWVALSQSDVLSVPEGGPRAGVMEARKPIRPGCAPQ